MLLWGERGGGRSQSVVQRVRIWTTGMGRNWERRRCRGVPLRIRHHLSGVPVYTFPNSSSTLLPLYVLVTRKFSVRLYRRDLYSTGVLRVWAPFSVIWFWYIARLHSLARGITSD